MRITEAFRTRRSIRKFGQKPIDESIIIDLIDSARLAPYPMNLQPLKFAPITEQKMLETIFPCTKWAGYLENGTPQKSERPTAYIAILGDRSIKSGGDFKVETGIAGCTIVTAAMEYGVGSCWLGALDREEISKILRLPESLELQDIIALGEPMQKSAAVEMNEDVRYYLEGGELKVPKRSLSEIIYREEKKNAF